MPKKIYYVTITYDFVIEAESEEEAMEKGLEWIGEDSSIFTGIEVASDIYDNQFDFSFFLYYNIYRKVKGEKRL